MKTLIFGIKQANKLQRMGRKVKSHGTFRAKRHPSSPRVRTEIKSGLYKVQY